VSVQPQFLPATVQERAATQAADLDRRLKTQERGEPMVQAGDGPPTGNPRDGVLYVDRANVRLYVRAAGTWRYTPLT